MKSIEERDLLKEILFVADQNLVHDLIWPTVCSGEKSTKKDKYPRSFALHLYLGHVDLNMQRNICASKDVEKVARESRKLQDR